MVVGILTFSATWRGFLLIAQGHRAEPLWEMARLMSPLLWGLIICIHKHIQKNVIDHHQLRLK